MHEKKKWYFFFVSFAARLNADSNVNMRGSNTHGINPNYQKPKQKSIYPPHFFRLMDCKNANFICGGKRNTAKWNVKHLLTYTLTYAAIYYVRARTQLVLLRDTSFTFIFIFFWHLIFWLSHKQKWKRTRTDAYIYYKIHMARIKFS